MPVLTIKVRVHADAEVERVLRDVKCCAGKVCDGLMWHLRRQQEETGRGDVRRSNLNGILAALPRAKGGYSMSVELTRDEVGQAWRSFLVLGRKGRTNHDAPGFRSKAMLCPLKYVQSGSQVEGERLRLSLGTGREDGVRSVVFRIGWRPGVKYERVREVFITYDYSGRLNEAVRRYWREVWSKVKPSSGGRPRKSRRCRQTVRRGRRQVEHLLHIVTPSSCVSASGAV